MTTTPPPAFFVPASRRACTRPNVFPVDPREIGLRFCKGCSRWLSPKFWATKTASELENRCDHCLRAQWAARNKRSRGRAPAVSTTMTVPKGWGF